MNHDDIRHKLSEYIDNALSADERAAVDAHLRSCTTCSDALEELRKTVEQVKQVEEIEPPAWMTQKIMAKVRAEAEEKKRWYQRFIFPLGSNVPIRAIAVLFLAVSAYYLYQNINPAGKYQEEPHDRFESPKPSAPAPSRSPEPKLQGGSAEPAKHAGQTAGYRALDMKQEYETPGPPVPREPNAPVPAASAPAMESKKDAASGAGVQAIAPQPAAPPAVLDKAERSMEAVATKEEQLAEPALQRKAKSAVAETSGIRFSVSVADLAAADKNVEDVVKELKGSVIRRVTRTDSRIIVVSLDANKLGVLPEKLGKLGNLKETEKPSAGRQGHVQVEIMLTVASRK